MLDYTLKLDLRDASYAAYMRADQQARTLTYHPEQQYTSDVLFEVPPDPLHAVRPSAGAARRRGRLREHEEAGWWNRQTPCAAP